MLVYCLSKICVNLMGYMEMSEIKATLNSNGEGQVRKAGCFSWEDGSSYDGDIMDGKPDGQGTYIWPDGDKYVGAWKNGQREGLGCHSRTNGFIFIGEFHNNLPHGEGFYVGPDGICYSGTWVLGKQQGKGMLKDQNEGVIFFWSVATRVAQIFSIYDQ